MKIKNFWLIITAEPEKPRKSRGNFLIIQIMKITATLSTRVFYVFLLSSLFSLNSLAQEVKNDILKNARVGATESYSGSTTYDGSGAGTAGTNGTYVGYNAGQSTTGESNSFYGANSGYSNTTGTYNSFIGFEAGYSNTSGVSNVFVGSRAGRTNSTGTGNSFFGNNAGRFNVSGANNSFIGYQAGLHNTTGEGNSYLGYVAGISNQTGSLNTSVGLASGYSNTSGSRNTIVGFNAGYNSTSGSGNVFLGYRAGMKELSDNKLYIANDSTSNPLVYGDFSAQKLVFSGKVGIQTSAFPTTVGAANINAYQLFVKGGILTDEIRVRTGWADYVFHKGYSLKSLDDVENFILHNGHLPNVPSAKQIETNGLELGDIARIQQEKIEELTLYIIEQNKKLSSLEKEINEIKAIIKH